MSARFQREPDFGVTSVNYSWAELWERGADPLAAAASVPRVEIFGRSRHRQEDLPLERHGELDSR